VVGFDDHFEDHPGHTGPDLECPKEEKGASAGSSSPAFISIHSLNTPDRQILAYDVLSNDSAKE